MKRSTPGLGGRCRDGDLRSSSHAWWVLVGMLFLAGSLVGPEAVLGAGVDQASTEVGRRMYREGIGPSGEPLIATVTGDVAVTGAQLSCQTCHGRSGMGSAEGQVIVPAIAGSLLYVPSPQPERPAYDRASLARALREGVNPAGRPLASLMPRYRLSDDEVASLAGYLAGLSVAPSPGTDANVVRWATVVADEVPADVRESVLSVLKTYFDEKNRQTRLESQRPGRGSAPASRLPTFYREWALDVWTLTGPASGWRAQLEERYARAPVFALIGGLSSGSWSPIGRFCESHEIPCLMPMTDLPDAEANDFYTLYFSRGIELEADLIAEHLATRPVGRVAQVYCGTIPSRAARALRSTLTKEGVAVEDLEFDCDESPPSSDVISKRAGESDAAVVLWMTREQIAQLGEPLPAGRLYFSSTLLDRDLEGSLRSAPETAFVAHPYRLPGATDPAMGRFTVWARTRGIEIRHPRLQAEAFFACLAANDALSHLRRYLVRDYMLDMLDHAQGLTAYLPIHGRPTLGPGQRFLTKGGYVLPVVDGRFDTKDAAWILP